MSSDQFDFLFRVIVIGDSGVGKTNLLLRFIKNEFEFETHPTIGIDFSTKTVHIDSQCIKAQIWDTAGQDRFRSISTAFYRGSVAALLVYDITNENTFKNLEKWMDDVRKYADPEIVITLVGNKCDMESARRVKLTAAKEFAEKNNMSFIETSAMDSINVEEAFMNVIKDVYYRYCISKKQGTIPIEINERKKIKFDNVKIEDKKPCCSN
ncbi:unnamed protein product [Brachionus calyciflorus]|uniref:Uncharacterized protein n=1 Tax=Brachionus calyciflorus TaxID=104777 RepID=A0A813LZB0_9BILA|nr:unnamed protein product [Brachionus calyciflorus]